MPSSAQQAYATSMSSLELDSSTQMSLRESLMALEPISGTVGPSGWTTTSSAATTSSSQASEDHQSSNDKQLAMIRSSVALREPVSFSVLPENVLERIFYEVSSRIHIQPTQTIN